MEKDEMENTENKVEWSSIESVDERSLEDAWMLDYVDKTDGSWIRVPFLTWNQVTRVLLNLTHQKVRNRLIMFKDKTVEDIDWGGVRIQSERDLDVMVDEEGNEEDRYPDDENYKFVPVCTKRAYLFGELYDHVEMYRSGEINPSNINGWDIPKHMLEDGEDVIKHLRESYPEGIDWDEYDAEMSSYEDEEETEGSKSELRLVSDNA